jgi:hypothetical protein
VLTTQLREIGQYCLFIHAAGQILEYPRFHPGGNWRFCASYTI